MSGAFNIDIEAEEIKEPKDPKEQKKGDIHVYCTTLTEAWETSFLKDDLRKFANALLQEAEAKTAAPPVPNVDNIIDVETYLCSLGCSPKVLHSKTFYAFLNIPPNVRDGLQYATDKPFGKTVASGYLQKYISFLEKKDGRKRFVRVTLEDRGGSVSLYSDDKSQQIIGSMKLINKVVVATTPLERSFVLKTGKRQWLFQAFDIPSFNNILSSIINIMKQFPDAKLPDITVSTTTTTTTATSPNGRQNTENYQNPTIIITKQATEADLPKLQEENQKLTQQAERLQEQYEGAEYEHQQLVRLKNSLSQGAEDMKTQIENEFLHDREEFVKDYEQQTLNLKEIIADLERQMTAKAAISDTPPLKFGFKLKLNLDKKKEKKR